MGARSVINGVLLLIVTYLPAFIAVSILVSLDLSFASTLPANLWMPPIVVGITVSTAILLIVTVGKGQFAQYGFRPPQSSYIWRALFIGFVVGVLLHFATELGGVGLSFMGQPPFIYLVLLFWIGAPIQEEIIFRGLFQSYLATSIKGSVTVRKWKLPIPALIGAIAFSLVHIALLSVEATVGGVFATVAGALILGIFAEYFRAETGSLVEPIIIHALFNVTGIVFEIL